MLVEAVRWEPEADHSEGDAGRGGDAIVESIEVESPRWAADIDAARQVDRRLGWIGDLGKPVAGVTGSDAVFESRAEVEIGTDPGLHELGTWRCACTRRAGDGGDSEVEAGRAGDSRAVLEKHAACEYLYVGSSALAGGRWVTPGGEARGTCRRHGRGGQPKQPTGQGDASRLGAFEVGGDSGTAGTGGTSGLWGPRRRTRHRQLRGRRSPRLVGDERRRRLAAVDKRGLGRGWRRRGGRAHIGRAGRGGDASSESLGNAAGDGTVRVFDWARGGRRRESLEPGLRWGVEMGVTPGRWPAGSNYGSSPVEVVAQCRRWGGRLVPKEWVRYRW